MINLNKSIYIYKLSGVESFGLPQRVDVATETYAPTQEMWSYREYWCFCFCQLQFLQLCNNKSGPLSAKCSVVQEKEDVAAKREINVFSEMLMFKEGTFSIHQSNAVTLGKMLYCNKSRLTSNQPDAVTERNEVHSLIVLKFSMFWRQILYFFSQSIYLITLVYSYFTGCCNRTKV